jgi:hypothetical protein
MPGVSTQERITLYEIALSPFHETFSIHFVIRVSPYFHTYFFNEIYDSWGACIYPFFKKKQCRPLRQEFRTDTDFSFLLSNSVYSESPINY